MKYSKLFSILSVLIIWTSCRTEQSKEVSTGSEYEIAINKMFQSSDIDATKEAFILNMKPQPEFKYEDLKCFTSQNGDYAIILEGNEILLALHQHELSSSKGIVTKKWEGNLISKKSNSTFDEVLMLKSLSRVRNL